MTGPTPNQPGNLDMNDEMTNQPPTPSGKEIIPLARGVDNSISSDEFWAEIDFLTVSLAAQWDYFEELGVKELPAGLLKKALLEAPSPKPSQSPPQPGRQAAGPVVPPKASSQSPTRDEENKPALWAPETASLEELSRRCLSCSACGLAELRIDQPVSGHGSPSPLVVVVGPTPTIFQDEKSALLTAIMEKGLELKPDEYYSTSLLKCAPPDEQLPPGEADAYCWPILKREFELLKPKIILVLGKKPAQQITGRHGEPFGLLRPRTHHLPGLKAFIRITYGLEDIISDPELKKAAWQDLKKVKAGLMKIKTDKC